jgi:parallel beta-helix repeat protein
MMDLASILKRAPANSTVSVPAGTYEGDLRVKVSHLTVRAQPGSVTIRGGAYGIVAWDNSAPGLIVDGLVFTGQDHNPVYIKTGCHGSAVRNCRMSGMRGSGILSANSHDVVVEDNQLFDGQDHGIYLSQSGDRLIVRRNSIKGMAAAAIQINAHQPGQKPKDPARDGLSFDCLIEGNLIEASGQKGGAGINLSGVCRSIVRNNTIRGMKGGQGIACFSDLGGGKPCRAVRIEGNHIAAVHAAVQIAKGSVDCVVIGNTLAGNPLTDYQEHVRTS